MSQTDFVVSAVTLCEGCGRDFVLTWLLVLTGFWKSCDLSPPTVEIQRL